MDQQEIVVEFLIERPSDRGLLASIFRTIHTCGFLGFCRLQETRRRS